jgi:Ca2+-binding RTX toxin-like protein
MKLLDLITGGSSRFRSRERRRHLSPRLETLEGRELKDGGISMIGGVVDIAGATNAANSVTISYTDSSHSVVAVTWNNTTVDFNRGAVNAIDFEGQGGYYDTFYNFTDVGATARGGDGTNVFYGGTGSNTFSGGNGYNIFWSNGTNDTLTGGNGTNIFFAGTGNDTLTGGNGTNIFYGVTANDSVTVGSGFSFIQRS